MVWSSLFCPHKQSLPLANYPRVLRGPHPALRVWTLARGDFAPIPYQHDRLLVVEVALFGLLMVARGTRARPANKADGMSKCGSDFAQNLANGISNRARTASCKEKSHRLVTAIVSHNERARIAACTETAAMDDDLICITDDVFFTLAAADLILDVHARID